MTDVPHDYFHDGSLSLDLTVQGSICVFDPIQGDVDRVEDLLYLVR